MPLSGAAQSKMSLNGQRYYVDSNTIHAAGVTETMRNYKDVQKTVKIYHKFPKKLIVPDLKGSDDVTFDFIRTQQPEDLTWMVFNVSCASNAPNVHIRRCNRWRDSEGIAA